MKRTLAALFSLMVMGQIAQAAPYYTGIGCNEEGTKCIAGKPSGRVLKWSKKGTTQELGERCEKFLDNIEARKKVIAKSRKVELKYKEFHYSWSSELQANGQAKIICSVEIHSEVPDVKIKAKIEQKMFWVCDNKESVGICKHYMSECEAARDQLLRDPSVLDATIYKGASLLQGELCEIAAARFK